MKRIKFYINQLKYKLNYGFNVGKTFLNQNKFKIITGCSLLIVCLGITFVFLSKDKFKSERIVYENLAEEKTEEVLEIPEVVDNVVEYYFVDIKGSVNNPGVYSLEKGKRVVDAINIAGGLKNDANTKLLNLSREVSDEMVIIVYSNSEIQNYQSLKETKKVVENICKEEIKNDACICNDKSDEEVVGETETKEEKEELKESNILNTKETITDKININKATLEELITLPKIGEAKAKAIIEYRNTSGLFKTIEDIKNVSGIGDSLFESIKDYITI
ncbi:MAG: helix-hairpin-helix domain-containing protein [Bacilli bacterium]|nr:helix-hairpin-helix domain-containing protein [Bacilli bacterium]